MFEDIATQGTAGFLTAVTEQLAKLPAELGVPPAERGGGRTGNEGFADIAGGPGRFGRAGRLRPGRVGW